MTSIVNVSAGRAVVGLWKGVEAIAVSNPIASIVFV